MSRSHLTSIDLVAGPPPEVLAQIDVACERARELFSSDLALHFAVDDSAGVVWVELQLADGSVAELLSASEVVALACGEVATEAPLAA